MDIKSKVEALLFVSAKAVSVKELAEFLETKEELIREALESLMEELASANRGFRLLESAKKYQLASAPEYSELVAKFLKKEVSGELSRPSLEALTVIAYRGPISKLDLDRIRGVNCSLILRNLLVRGLIEENFSAEKKENYYSVSMDFVRHLGVNRVTELPDYEKLNTDDSLDRFLENQQKNEA